MSSAGNIITEYLCIIKETEFLSKIFLFRKLQTSIASLVISTKHLRKNSHIKYSYPKIIGLKMFQVYFFISFYAILLSHTYSDLSHEIKFVIFTCDIIIALKNFWILIL